MRAHARACTHARMRSVHAGLRAHSNLCMFACPSSVVTPGGAIAEDYDT